MARCSRDGGDDGWAAHGDRRAIERDHARDVRLHARGWVVLRFGWRQVMGEPHAVVTRVAEVRAVAARRRALGAVSGAP